MPIETPVSEENFQQLLKWLDPDGDAAGVKYESIRRRLIRLFISRGCCDSEALADRTIDRVAFKLPRIMDQYSGRPELYFYGVARKVHLEWLRSRKDEYPIDTVAPYAAAAAPVSADPSEDALDCLEECLRGLATDRRELIVAYYRGEKSSKIRSRKELRQQLGVSESAMQVRVSRIRGSLRECVKGCLAGRSA